MPKSNLYNTFQAPSDDTGEAYVFRDFERSRIATIRHAVARHPLRNSVLFFAVVLTWTAVMSAAAANHGSGSLAVNLAPHVAHFTIILGFMFYPFRLIWVPALAYLVVFIYPFYQPLTSTTPWHALPGMSLPIAAALFGINLGYGLLLGQIHRWAYALARTRLRPHSVDLFISMMSFATFILITVKQIYVMQEFAAMLPPETAAAMGFGPDFFGFALERTLRGGVVIATFLLAAIESPRQDQLAESLALALLFPLMAFAQSHGFVLYPAIDVVVLGLIVVLVRPVGVALFAVLMGIPVYAAITGEFQRVVVPATHDAWVLEQYGILALFVLTMTMAAKSHSTHLFAEKDAAIRKLSRARDFAGVGLVAMNRVTGRYRLDRSGQRMLRLAAEGPLDDFLLAFPPADQNALVGALAIPARRHEVLVVHPLPEIGGQQTVLRLFLWSDTTPSGDGAAYGLFLDETEAEVREHTLRDTLDELSNRQDRQRQLFSIISHELRTPASVVSILVDDMKDTTDPERLHRQLREATDQLLSVLEDMRQTVNPEQNLPVRRVPYSPADLAESVRNAMMLMARDKGIVITLLLGQGAGQGRVGDTVRVRQALTNLTKNAIIHSGGGRITIAYTSHPPTSPQGVPISEWRVEDDGVGIPHDQVERLFQPFERGGKDPRQMADGSGLGLFIARQSIKILGGSLDHYTPPRGGTGYIITVPEEVAQDTPVSQIAAKPTAVVALEQSGPVDVLLAEDNALVADVTRARLEKLGMRVRLARNGREALSMVADRKPDMIITDLFMPELDGDDLVRRLRADGYNRPIVGMTAAVVGEEMDRFQQAGTNVVMRKPLDFAALSGYVTDGFPAI